MTTPSQYEHRGLTGPLLMILAGAILLAGQFVPELGFQRLWPLLLIGGGVAALMGRR
ncbi:MAG: hypothetical protein HYX27_14395 [Acidobacteria bacterium]|nr:hypothetical protein [Acidobacteriota bacterium]